MLSRFSSWPIRVHLLILVALLALPTLSLIVHSSIVARNEAINEAKKDRLRLVDSLAAERKAVVAGAEQLVTTLALIPEVQSRNREATSTLFSDLLKKNPQYANIFIAHKSGVVWASAVPLEGKVSVSDRKYFREAVRTGMFSSGEYGVGRISKMAVITFGYPVKNNSNEVIAVIGVALDLNYTQNIFEKIGLPPGGSFSLLDHQGIILIRSLQDTFSDKLVGRRDTSEEIFTKMMKGPDQGTFESVGNDGNFRLVAYKIISLPHESKPYLYVRSSVPLASVTSKANAALLKNLTLLMVVFGMGLFLVWLIGKQVIINPILMLKKASQELGAGADTGNVSTVVKGGELGELAQAFDNMAKALVQRENTIRESEQRWAITLASIGDAVIATDVVGNIVFMNAVAEQLTGWMLHDALQKPIEDVFHIINERTRGEVESPVKKVLREGIIIGLGTHTILMRKDGAEVPIDNSGAPIRDADGKNMGVVLIFRNVTERKLAEDKIKSLLAEKELLLREVHHRIKNNMNVINSLLTLQAGTLKDPSAIAALKESSSRVRSMMALYDKLYRSASFNTISVMNYLPSLVDEIVANFSNSKSVKIDKRIDDFILDAKRLQPLGIIINELLTNIMKYAFTGRDTGFISVSATLTGNKVALVIEDNGAGMPESIDFENSPGFGLTLVGILTKQLEGTIRIERENGTRIILEFEV